MDTSKLVVENLSAPIADKTKVVIDEFGRPSAEITYDSFLTPQARTSVLTNALNDMAFLKAGYLERKLLVEKTR